MLREKQKYAGRAIELVATIEGRIVGFLDIGLEASPGEICYRKVEGNGMIWDTGVLPEFRRMGIATKLLDEGVRLGKFLGVKRLEAWSIEPAAWNFFENYGFQKFFEYYHVLIDNR